MNPVNVASLFFVLCLAAAAPLAAGPATQPLPVPPPTSGEFPEQGPLTLRVNDASVQPGGIAAAVIRTYASRGIGSGQVCLTVRQRAAGGPAITYLGADVFNPEDNALIRIQTEPDGIELQFAAPRPTINSVDGPLAVIYFRITSVAPGQEFDLLPMLDSYVIDAGGEPVPLELRSGRLRISGPGDGFDLDAATETVTPGATALLTLQTKELRLLSGGTLALRYDPAIAAGPPEVRVDSRHGSVVYDASASLPDEGLIVVQFTSPNADFNRVPGDLLEVMVPTRADIAPGTRSLVRPETALNVLVDAQGQALPLNMEATSLEFVAP